MSHSKITNQDTFALRLRTICIEKHLDQLFVLRVSFNTVPNDPEFLVRFKVNQFKLTIKENNC